MNHNQLTEILKYYRSYEYAAMNCGPVENDRLPLVISERMRNPGMWDKTRYNRIVNIIKGAVDYCLDDDQRTVIMRKYLERNRLTLSEISNLLHKDRTTIGRWHKEALSKLAIALEPFSEEILEITPLEHMFDSNWKFEESKEPA
ncbi:hypothetical protein [Paenibacillus rigui]|uniref:RNA polymerase sigma-70 region 4 domain-containing protein n=1 Tax=Paenibacillus rigui TaxID=554312 RepID=A0A229UKJ4_9BACL|nr:hypothetical protein [Paenibacillus rigui]OXM83977.1 hypothetical protein CF651_22970 [Paenibacillus rigui]